MLELETLVVALDATTDKFKSGLEDADSTSKSWASNLGSSVGGLLQGAVMVGAAAAAAAVISIGVAAFDVSSQVNAAAGDMAASLGIPTEEAREFAEVAKDVFGNNFANDVTDAADAVTQVAKQMRLAADDPALQTMTENAFRLRDAFGTEVNESVDAAKTLMDQFGISGDEAFDLLAKGYQSGLDRSGDFLDTIGEYSVQFAEGGASAVEFFSALDSGLQGGMLGTDKAADLFKEFRVRIQDGSDLTRNSLLAIGLDADTMTAQLADGSLSALDAFNMVQRALVTTGDSTTQFQAGVGLLGTQFEDLGASVALGIDITEDWAEGGIASITALDAQYNTFGDAATGVWRKIVVAVTPLTDALLNMVNAAMPGVMAAFDAATPIIEGTINALTLLVTGDFTGGIFGLSEDDPSIDALFKFREGAQSLWETVDSSFSAIQDAVGKAVDFVADIFNNKFGPSVEGGAGTLDYFKTWVDTNLPLVQTLFQNILSGITTFWDMFGEDIMHIVGNTFDTVFTVIDTVLKTVMDLITLTLQLLTGDWEGAWETMEGIVTRIWDTIVTVVGNQLDSIWTAVTSIDWIELGRSIIQGMIDGIIAMSSRLWDAARETSQNLWDSMTGWWETGSPSDKAMDELGVPIGQGTALGIGKGLDAAMGRVDSAMAGLYGRMAGAPVTTATSASKPPINITIYADSKTTADRVQGGVLAGLRQAGLA